MLALAHISSEATRPSFRRDETHIHPPLRRWNNHSCFVIRSKRIVTQDTKPTHRRDTIGVPHICPPLPMNGYIIIASQIVCGGRPSVGGNTHRTTITPKSLSRATPQKRLTERRDARQTRVRRSTVDVVVTSYNVKIGFHF